MKIPVLLILFLFSSCGMEPEGDDRLRIVNHTNYNFSIYYNIDTVPEFPSVNHTYIYLRDSIKINDTINIQEYNRKPWPWFFETSKNRKLNLFIYNINSLKIYSIDTLIKRKIYKRLTFSKAQLEKLNWTVVIKD